MEKIRLTFGHGVLVVTECRQTEVEKMLPQLTRLLLGDGVLEPVYLAIMVAEALAYQRHDRQGNGIGRELVFQLLTKGARVAAVDIDEAKLKETVSLAGGKGKLSMHMVNVTDRSAVEKLPAEVIKAHGAVDGLINNAGIIQKFVRFNDLDLSLIHI